MHLGADNLSDRFQKIYDFNDVFCFESEYRISQKHKNFESTNTTSWNNTRQLTDWNFNKYFKNKIKRKIQSEYIIQFEISSLWESSKITLSNECTFLAKPEPAHRHTHTIALTFNVALMIVHDCSEYILYNSHWIYYYFCYYTSVGQ